jgi:glutamyl-tRNA synthetase
LLLSIWEAPLPTYAHVGLVTTAAGDRLAKRDASISLAQLRADGVQASAVVRQLARLSGLPDTGDLDHLTDAIDLRTLSPGAVALDGR